MRYSIANLGQAEPERFVPEGLTDCSSLADYRRAVENAAARIAYYNQALQRAVAEENYGGIDRAKMGADQANRDWEVWSKAVKKCEASAAETAAPETQAAPKSTVTTLVALGAAAAAVAFVIAIPKLHSIKFWKTGGK